MPLTSEAAQLQAPVGGSWFWGGGPAAEGAGAGELPPNPDAQELRPLYQRLPFRQAWCWGWLSSVDRVGLCIWVWNLLGMAVDPALACLACGSLVAPRQYCRLVSMLLLCLCMLMAPSLTGACSILGTVPCSFRNSRWSDEEQQKLRDGVVQLVQVQT